MFRYIFIFLTIMLFCGCSRQEKNIPVEKTDIAPQKVMDLSPAYGDTIIEHSISDAVVLNPLIYPDANSGDIIGMIFNGLVRFDENLELVGDLAESWVVSENGLEITFHLYKDVKWHDGKNFTAYDAKFTYDRLMDPNTKTMDRDLFNLVKKVEAVDPYTFKVVYEKKYALAVSIWSFWIVPEHLLMNEDVNTCKFNQNPVGTGPFMFVAWSPDEEIILEANESYFRGRPFVDRYMFKIIQDKSMAFLALKRGEIDMMGLTPDQYQKQAGTELFLERFNVYRYSSLFGYSFLGYNNKNSLFSDPRIRKAMTHAINRDEIIKEVLHGYGEKLSGPCAPNSWTYNRDIKPLPFSPEKARELLLDAGFNDTDGDGVLEREGKPFEFELCTNHGNERRRLTSQLIKEYLRQIGIRAYTKVYEWGVLMDKFDAMDYEAMLIGWQCAIDPDYYLDFHTSQIPVPSEGKAGLNFMGYSNPEADELLEKARTELDQEKRKLIYHDFHSVIHQDQPATYLYVSESITAVDKRIMGIRKTKKGLIPSLEKLYIPRSLQKY